MLINAEIYFQRVSFCIFYDSFSLLSRLEIIGPEKAWI